jgi:hypothetical protein
MPESTEFDGFYAIYYQGEAGPGLGQIQLTEGKIIGSDVTGGIWDGDFAIDAVHELISCEITIQLPKGTPLATTGAPPVGNEAANMRFKLPLDFSTREYVALELPIGKVNVKFKRIR